MMKSRWSKTGFVFLGIFTALIITMHSCMPAFRLNSKEVSEYFQKSNINGTQESYQHGFREMHYITAGEQTKPLVLFIHGSPGSLSAFIHFLADTSLTNHLLLVSTDRPGFGYSNYGNAESSLKKQGDNLKPILEKFHQNRPIILVGHSLGGPLICRMAMDYPNLVDGLIIVAGSIDPELEPNETWFRAPLATPFLSWVLPGSFRASNEEIYHLKPELEEMLPLWKNIACPVTVIQGNNDDLVPKENADFAVKMLVNTHVDVVRVDGMNHFVPWSNPDLIHDAILNMLPTINARQPLTENNQKSH
jgi:pimeloyl-ACP methyl ester carboxylesterase